MNSQILLIDPAMHTPELCCHQLIASISSLPIKLFMPQFESFEILKSQSSSFAGIIILGSAASPVINPPSWQTSLMQWLYQSQQRNTPLLGICYGFQLIAHITGGKVQLLWDGEKKRGVRMVDATECALWSFKNSVPLIVSHREGVTDLTQDWSCLSRSSDHFIELAYHQGFPWWGIQAHIEATQGFLRRNQIDMCLPNPYAGHVILQSFIDQCTQTVHIENDRI